jgi:hypothetical protein
MNSEEVKEILKGNKNSLGSNKKLQGKKQRLIRG